MSNFSQEIQQWKNIVVESTRSQTAINQAISKLIPNLEREEDQFSRSDVHSNLTIVADLLMVLQDQFDLAIPLVQVNTADKKSLELLQQLNRQNLKRISSQLHSLAKIPPSTI
jgi:septal ring factor EnvC (AmiA/AmiB activator)